MQKKQSDTQIIYLGGRKAHPYLGGRKAHPYLGGRKAHPYLGGRPLWACGSGKGNGRGGNR